MTRIKTTGVDPLTDEKRRYCMSRVRSRDTKPEMLIRLGLHRRGRRYRLHVPLPGKPDIAFRRFKAVIFINGCFWHGHDCSRFKLPVTRAEFWSNKINHNRERDSFVMQELLKNGWRVMIIWECAIRGKFKLDINEILDKIELWLDSSVKHISIREKQ